MQKKFSTASFFALQIISQLIYITLHSSPAGVNPRLKSFSYKISDTHMASST